MPGGIAQGWRYDPAGRVKVDSILNSSTSGHKFTQSILRQLSLTYDARGKALMEWDGAGKKDSLSADYSGLGYLVRSAYSDSANTILGPSQQGRSSSTERFRYTALGDQTLDTLTYTGRINDAVFSHTGPRTRAYEAGTGRLRTIVTVGERVDSLFYDAAGNIEFSTASAFPGFGPQDVEDRASYYDAADRLRVVDHRWSRERAGTSRALWPIRYVFDVYRYDALGRRVLVRSRRECNPGDLSMDDCALSFIRRTIWDGAQEVFEIQQPGESTAPEPTLERDTGPVGVLPMFARADGLVVDRNAFYGRVAYTHGLSIDQPLAITRWEYADSAGDIGVQLGYQRWVEPFVIVPHWTMRGVADNGSFFDGGRTICGGGGISGRCVRINWQFGWSAYGQPTYRVPSWHGSLIEDKRDGTGLMFRRNRYVDPNSGRFTQEDPIGLAGGMNLYGFASGDPVNFRDPFGLRCEPFPRCLFPKDLGSLSSWWQWFTDAWSGRGAGTGPATAKGVAEGAFRDLGAMGSLAKGSGLAIGGARRLNYEANPKHGLVTRGDVSARPANGQDALDNSLEFVRTSNTSGRIGIDYETGDFVVFREHTPGNFHGYVVPWNELTDTQRNVLIRAGMADRRGRIRQ